VVAGSSTVAGFIRAKKLKRVLVIATRQIGDVLLTTPLIAAARQLWPDAHIEVLGFSGTLGMLNGNAQLDAIIESPPRLGLRGFVRLVQKLWRRYDLALITQPGDRAHLMGWISSGCRSGLLPEQESSSWWKQILLTYAVQSSGDRSGTHVVTEKLALLAPWKEASSTAPRVVVPEAAPLPAFLSKHLRPGFIVIHTPSMWSYKQWPLAHYRQLIAALLSRGHQIVLSGGPDEQDRVCVESMLDLGRPPGLINACGELDFNQLVTLFKQASLYIGPDTSVSHLAAASNVTTLAIFGPTDPRRWAPWPGRSPAQVIFERSSAAQTVGNVTVMQGGLGCVPCSRAGCDDHRQSRSDCLIAIKPEQVLEQALRLLGSSSPAI
jgi:heptosyltransferase III